MPVLTRECESPAERARREHVAAHLRRIQHGETALHWAAQIALIGLIATCTAAGIACVAVMAITAFQGMVP